LRLSILFEHLVMKKSIEWRMSGNTCSESFSMLIWFFPSIQIWISSKHTLMINFLASRQLYDCVIRLPFVKNLKTLKVRKQGETFKKGLAIPCKRYSTKIICISFMNLKRINFHIFKNISFHFNRLKSVNYHRVCVWEITLSAYLFNLKKSMR
jgi:hypothetical protein